MFNHKFCRAKSEQALSFAKNTLPSSLLHNFVEESSSWAKVAPIRKRIIAKFLNSPILIVLVAISWMILILKVESFYTLQIGKYMVVPRENSWERSISFSLSLRTFNGIFFFKRNCYLRQGLNLETLSGSPCTRLGPACILCTTNSYQTFGKSKVGFIYTFWYSLLSTRSILE